MMRTRTIAGIPCYVPRQERETQLANQAEAHLRREFQQGTYVDADEMNAVIKHQAKFWLDTINIEIEELASREFMDFVLSQFDQASKIDDLHRKGKLNPQDTMEWEEFGPRYKRAIKYLAERCTMLSPEGMKNNQITLPDLLRRLDDTWIAAEELVRCCMMSDQVHGIRKIPATLTVTKPGSAVYWEFDVDPEIRTDFLLRISQHRQCVSDILSRQFELDVSEHDAVIGSTFKSEHGISYAQALELIQIVSRNCAPGDNFPTLFCLREGIIKKIEERYGVAMPLTQRVLDGFTVTQENLEKEGREYWNPKTEHRAYRRAFFRVPHSSGEHLAWSEQMARESLHLLLCGAPFGFFPEEWLTENMKKSLSQLNNKATRWFEKETSAHLRVLDVQGQSSQPNSLGTGRARITLPAGDLDFIGYSGREHSLILLECKMVFSGTEPKWWRAEVTNFCDKDNNYRDKFLRKIQWTTANVDRVCDALRSLNVAIDVNPRRVKTAMLTYFPSITTYLIDQFPCRALTEFVTDYRNCGAWPYECGEFSA